MVELGPPSRRVTVRADLNRDISDEKPEPTTSTPAMTLDRARLLADELIRQLAQHIGDEDPDAMDAVFRRWLDTLDAEIYVVALAALRTTFVDCLTVTDPATWPPNGTALAVETNEENP